MADKDTEATWLERQGESLPSLFSRLSDELTRLLDSKLELLKVELKEELSAYTVGAVLIVIGALIAIVGFALLNVAIAFLISTLFDSMQWSPAARYGVGFVITALVYLVIGAALIISAKNRLAKQRIVPRRSALELKRDKEWLKQQI